MYPRHADADGGAEERRPDLPTTRRRALQAGVVGLGSVVGLGGQVTAAGGACEVTEADLLATRDAWADPALVEGAVADQPEMLAALAERDYLDSTADAVVVTARRLECEAVPEILVFRRPDQRFLTASIRPESGSAYAMVVPPSGPDYSGDPGDPGDPGDEWEWRERYGIWWTSSGERGCHPPCWVIGPGCKCEEREVSVWEDWDYRVCSDYRCWYYVFECDCPDLECWPGCIQAVEPIEIDMDPGWWDGLP